jgi:hypothetical protein
MKVISLERYVTTRTDVVLRKINNRFGLNTMAVNNETLYISWVSVLYLMFVGLLICLAIGRRGTYVDNFKDFSST